MVLKARFLSEVQSPNWFNWRQRWEFVEGDAPTLYLQLVDATLDRPEDGFKPGGRRYVAAPGATLQVTFINIDDAKKVLRFASQPFAQDPSIWSVQLMPGDPVRGTPQLSLVLTQGSQVATGLMNQAVLARPKSNLASYELYQPPANALFD